MHRRARHFKGSSIGCNLQLDARYITDSDGTAVSTWTDRSSNAYSASQATSTKQPVVKTRANGINGNTTVSFDGTNDGLVITSFTINSDMYCLMACKLSTQGMYFEQTRDANAENAFYIYGQSNRNIHINRVGLGTYFVYGINNWVGTSNSVVTVRYSDANGGNYYTNGNVITKSGETDTLTAATNSTKDLNIMCRNQDNLFSGGLIGSVILGSGDLSEPLRKRLQSILAFSFKIACS